MEPSLKKGALGIAGHARVQEQLARYLSGGRWHPAVIVGGSHAEEKLQLARNIAKFFLCPKKPKGELYCDKCSACRRIDNDNHPDVLICIEKGESTIKIDTVRDFCHQMELSPVEGSAKVCIVDECHRLNAASANAFLKTLEEPKPGRYFWLLTSQVGSLLPTVLSRCLKFSFPPDLASQRKEPSFKIQYVDLFATFLKTGDPEPLLLALDSKEKAIEFLGILQTRLRDAAIDLASGVTPAEPFREGSVFKCLNDFEDSMALEGRLRSNANYALMLESFLNRNFRQEELRR